MLQPNNQMEPQQNNQNPPHYIPPIVLGSEAENSPLLCFFQGLIKRCYGCNRLFKDKLRDPPRDLIVKFKVKRPRCINNKWIPGFKDSWAYFHLNLNCMRLGRSTIELQDVYMNTDIFMQLNEAHKDYLRQKGWWQDMRCRLPKD